MRKNIATLVLLSTVLGLAGCPLVTVTEGFEYDVLYWQNGGNPYDLTGQGDWTDVIDLSNEKDFKDNQDKIENVDRVASGRRQASHRTAGSHRPHEDAVPGVHAHPERQ